MPRTDPQSAVDGYATAHKDGSHRRVLRLTPRRPGARAPAGGCTRSPLVGPGPRRTRVHCSFATRRRRRRSQSGDVRSYCVGFSRGADCRVQNLKRLRRFLDLARALGGFVVALVSRCGGRRRGTRSCRRACPRPCGRRRSRPGRGSRRAARRCPARRGRRNSQTGVRNTRRLFARFLAIADSTKRSQAKLERTRS